MTVSKPIGSSVPMEDIGCSSQVGFSGAKNTLSGHIVYVRRKPNTEIAKSNVSENQSQTVPHSKRLTDQGETTQQHIEMNGHIRCSISPSLGMCCSVLSPGNVNNVNVKCANFLSDEALTVNTKLWEERYFRLLSLLKMLDQSDQDDYVQMLRLLSSVELSSHAVELEKRSIKLSLEEAKELQRVGMFGVLGKYTKNGGIGSTP